MLQILLLANTLLDTLALRAGISRLGAAIAAGAMLAPLAVLAHAAGIGDAVLRAQAVVDGCERIVALLAAAVALRLLRAAALRLRVGVGADAAPAALGA